MTDKIVTTRTRVKYQAGRPRLSKDEPTVGLHAALPQSYKEFLEKYGRGNISQGLRWLVEEKMEGKEEMS